MRNLKMIIQIIDTWSCYGKFCSFLGRNTGIMTNLEVLFNFSMYHIYLMLIVG